MLNTLSHLSALPDHMPRLKKLFNVMLHCNLGFKYDDVNETRYIVLDKINNLLILRIAPGMCNGWKLNLPKFIFGPGDDSFFVFGFKGLQFQISFCVSITLNEVQRRLFA